MVQALQGLGVRALGLRFAELRVQVELRQCRMSSFGFKICGGRRIEATCRPHPRATLR